MVMIYEQSGFISFFKKLITKLLTNGKIESDDWEFRPFTCSLCMTFWLSLLYCFVNHCITIPMIAFILLISILTTEINDLIILIKNLITKLIQYIDDKIN